MSSSWWSQKLSGDSQRPSWPSTPPQSQVVPRVAPARPAPTEQRCPECGSGNYLLRPSARCFDCNYQSRDVRNSTQGMSMTTDPRGATPAPQVESGGYSGQIIGRVE